MNTGRKDQRRPGPRTATTPTNGKAVSCARSPRAATGRAGTGLTDCWTWFEADKQGRRRFTWWDYRGGWARNAGLRIDHVLASKALAQACTGCAAHVGERGRKRPSDQVPVVGDFQR